MPRPPAARLLTALLLVAACATPAPAPPLPMSAAVGDATPTLVELVVAWSAGADELWRVLSEREGAVTLADPRGPRVIVIGPRADASVVLAVSLSDLPSCPPDSAAGVVVDDPPRVVGCGAQALAGLAAFLVAASHAPDVALVVVRVPEDLPAVAARAQVWSSTGGSFLRGAEVDVLALAAVTDGVVELELAHADGNLDQLLVALGRTLSWRGPPTEVAVLQDAEARLPRASFAWITGREERSATVRRERCSLAVLAMPSPPRVACVVLPGRGTLEVRDDVLRAIDDGAVDVRVLSSWAPTSTSLAAPLPSAIERRLGAELPRALLVPTLEEGPGASVCRVARLRGHPCVGGVPLLLHPAERAAVGAPDQVSVSELGAVAARVLDVAVALSSGLPRDVRRSTP